MKSILLWGFLGSGKTTFINHLVSTYFTTHRVVVLENESGKESVDSIWLQQQQINVIEMNSGCVCCTLKGEIRSKIQYIKDSLAPDVLIIEPSGISSLEELKLIDGVKFDSIITLIDINTYPILMKLNSEHYKRCFSLSPVIILTKGELIEPSCSKEIIQAIKDDIHSYSPMSHIIENYKSLPKEQTRNILERIQGNFYSLFSNYLSKSAPKFNPITIDIDAQRYTLHDLKSAFEFIGRNRPSVVRAKGIINSRNGEITRLDYVCGVVSNELMESSKAKTSSFITLWSIGDEFSKEDFINILNHYIAVELPCPINSLVISNEEINQYLGFRDKKPDNYFAAHIERLKQEAISICQPRFGIKHINNLEFRGVKRVVLSETEFTTGTIITHALEHSTSAILLIASIGEELNLWIEQMHKSEDILKGFIADALGSVIVEAVVSYALGVLGSKYRGDGLSISNSYSPGYCGWDVKEQHKLFSFFPLDFCGVQLTNSSLMLPIKSVSSIVGIGELVEKKEYGCAICKKRDCYKRRL